MSIKKIFQVAGPLHLENPVVRKAELLLANQYDYWIPTCQLSEKFYRHEGIETKKLKTVFYGTDIEHFKDRAKKGTLRKELAISEDTKIIGMVAFAYPPKKWLGQKRGIKGHEILIDAMKIVRTTRPDVICVMIGGPWGNAEDYYQDIVSYGKDKLGTGIHFLGTRYDVPRLYPDFDIAIHPSLSENLGGAGESLLMGIPTIASNTGGFPDIVIDNKTGWLFTPNNAKELSEKIVYVLDNLKSANQIAESARLAMLSELDKWKTSRDIYSFYNEILEIDHA